ncbi:TPA: hypothetical protein G9F27_004636 [Salmonella enterica]|uniref:Uncharacterized protein n=1 Tax=Salmonella enterica TaxID=28901 RepID=A0A743PGE3_SALER|nr:hypothetical protein [Salmonella enterica]
MKYFWNIFFDAVFVALIIAATVFGISGASTAVHVLLWLTAVFGLLVFVLPDAVKRLEEDYTHCPLLWRFYDLLTDLVIIALVVWMDWGVLAVFLLIRAMAKQEFYRKQEKRLKEQAA